MGVRLIYLRTHFRHLYCEWPVQAPDVRVSAFRSGFYCRACSSKRKAGIQFTAQRDPGRLEAGRKIKGMADTEAVVPLSCGRDGGAEISYVPGWVLPPEKEWGYAEG